MPSEMKVNKISPASGTAITLGDSGDTFTIPSGATITNNGTQNGFGSTSASDLTSGTLPDARFPATLPAASGVNLTALNATQLTSGTIPIARIADNAVTLAKMAGGTDGQIITYDASGDPVAVGPGTDGQVLTSTGAGSPPAFEDAAGGNSPRWWADFGSDQTITSGTVTRITGFPATGGVAHGGGYSNSRFTVPSGQAGDYIIGANLSFHDSNGDLTQVYTKFYKNGSWYYGGYGVSFNTSTNGGVHWADQAIMIATLAVGDYIDVYGQAVGTGTVRSFTNDGGNQRFTNFWGFKIG